MWPMSLLHFKDGIVHPTAEAKALGVRVLHFPAQLAQLVLYRLRLTPIRQLPEFPLQAQLVRLRLRLTRILQLRVFLQRLQSGLLRQEQIMFSRLRVFQQRVLSGLLALSVMSLLFLLELAVRVKSHKFWSGGRLFPDKMQIGRRLMKVKRQTGKILMTAKHQIGKR